MASAIRSRSVPSCAAHLDADELNRPRQPLGLTETIGADVSHSRRRKPTLVGSLPIVSRSLRLVIRRSAIPIGPPACASLPTRALAPPNVALPDAPETRDEERRRVLVQVDGLAESDAIAARARLVDETAALPDAARVGVEIAAVPVAWLVPAVGALSCGRGRTSGRSRTHRWLCCGPTFCVLYLFDRRAPFR
jgi:hypothetical protein